MSPRALIAVAQAEGLTLAVGGDNLVVETDLDPPAELIAQLRAYKAELIAVLSEDDLEKRAAIIAEGAGVPRAWAEDYAALCAMPPPAGFSPERWRRIIDMTGAVLDRWAGEAIRCGWSDLDVFGCHAGAPAARFDCMGLVLLLNRCKVAAIDRDGADLVTVTGARERFRRRKLPPGTVSLWELVKR